MDDKYSFFPPLSAHIDSQYARQPLERALRSAKDRAGDAADPKLKAACQEMESLFINQLFKEMRATIDKSDFISGGRAEEIFTSMLDVELSRKISNARGIGLSAILLEQLADKSNRKAGPDSE